MTSRHVCRLREEVEQLREAIDENEQLNKTLKLELGVYDKMAADGNDVSTTGLYFHDHPLQIILYMYSVQHT